MSELQTALPDEDIYKELAEQATNREDIVALREMAKSDLASVAIKPKDGEAFDVTAIGSTKFSELSNVDPEAVKAAVAIDSVGWHQTEK